MYVWYMSAGKLDDLSLNPRTHKMCVHTGVLLVCGQRPKVNVRCLLLLLSISLSETKPDRLASESRTQ